MNSGEGQQKGVSALPPAPRGVSAPPADSVVAPQPRAPAVNAKIRRYGWTVGLAVVVCASAIAWTVSAAPTEPAPLRVGLRTLEPTDARLFDEPPQTSRAEPEPEPEPPKAPPAPPEPEPAAEAPQPEPEEPAPSPERRLEPPGPGATRAERVTYARHVVERIRRSAVAGPYERTVIADESGRPSGKTRYPDEERTEQPLVLSAIVTPNDDRSAFAVIEHEEAGFVSSYSPGTMLWPGVLPGVWVIDIRPGVVHLLDLSSNSFEFLTFEEPMSPAERRAQERRERARKRRASARKRREARKRRRRGR